MILTANQGDTLDLLLNRHYSRTAELVEIALAHNPQIAETPILAYGQKVFMPDTEAKQATAIKQMVSLWG